MSTSTTPCDIGIVAAETYFPNQYVSQKDLETFDGVSEGKYTKGLGQTNMAVCTELEDINSVCLTAVHSLMEKYDIPYDKIGRLEVGTETLVDKSKSVKSVLMRLFTEKGNYDIEGIDTTNACYGGTAALLNSVNWMESSSWDGRYALVVTGDIAVYEAGPARPTGGAGVVAMLIGPNAPIVMEQGLRSTHMEDVFDFYKPTMVSEYPRVDGQLSNTCYLRALDGCYNRYMDKFEAKFGRKFSQQKDAAFNIFHQPYAKLVQKSYARFFYNDFKRLSQLTESEAENLTEEQQALKDTLEPFADVGLTESYSDRGLEKAAMALSQPDFTSKVEPSLTLGRQLGNSYCGSVYNGLCSLLSSRTEELSNSNKRVLMFSYGSGLAATLFSLVIKGDVSGIAGKLNLPARLEAREAVTPEEFTRILTEREENYTKYDYVPSTSPSLLEKGTYYLQSIDKLERRQYSRRAFSTFSVSKQQQETFGTPFMPSPFSTASSSPVLSADSVRSMARRAAGQAMPMLRRLIK